MKSFHFKTFLAGGILLVFAFSLMSLISYQQKPWTVDAKYKTMKNAVKADAASTTVGKALWDKNCAMCHGKTGLGDGVKARTLDTPAGDFTKAAYQSQTDGEIFGKTKTGREDMPKYDGKLTDEDIWNIVNYTRTLKK
jgi:mono/diheme cytochrome c family protein